jgi:hypothetical protein
LRTLEVSSDSREVQADTIEKGLDGIL